MTARVALVFVIEFRSGEAVAGESNRLVEDAEGIGGGFNFFEFNNFNVR